MTHDNYKAMRHDPYRTAHPHDLADVLHDIACYYVTDDERQTLKEELVDAMYDLDATAINKYNHDYDRTLYEVLVILAERIQNGTIKIEE